MDGGEETTIHAADSLARIIFARNSPAASMRISIPSLKGPKELFFLLLDLFIRGLLLLYPEGGRRGMAVHDISAEQFDALASRLRAAGIECKRSVTQGGAPACAPATNVAELLRSPDDMPLDAYRLRANTRGSSYTLWFKIVHNVGACSSRCGEPAPH